MRGIFIELRDLQKIRGISYGMAKKEMRTLRDIAGKKRITVKEYCRIEGITTDEFMEGIKMNDKETFRINLSL
jgi:hypothetical protein